MESNAWNNHLSRTLSDNGLIAYLWNVDKDTIEWTGDLQALLGIDPAHYPKNSAELNRLINPQDVPQRLANLRPPEATGAAPATLSASYRLRRANGLQVNVQESADLVIDPVTQDKILHGFIRILDHEQFALSSGKPLGNPFSFASYDTSMTHYGRLMIHQKIQEWSATQRSVEDSIGYLLVVGIDRLSMFNEAFGAQTTDEIIDKTGKRLRQMASENGTTARIDGDVFAMFFSEAPHAEMAAVAKHILNSFNDTPLQISRGPIGVGLSIGGVLVRHQCKDPADMITKAEMAMQTAKERGRGRFVSYNEAAGESQNARILLQSGDAFMAALKDNRVRLAFQPVVHSISSEVSFHESLIRFIDEQGKLQSAAQFMPAIEKLGLSRLVDRYALRLAINELEMFPSLELSVNVSNLTLSDPDWLRGLVSALRDRPQLAKRLIIEITESAAIYDLAKTIRIVKTLRDLGCRVALDDFGSGYTAFSQLKTMNIDLVKIDKSFVRGMAEKENHLFVKTLQTLAQGVNVKTVGEGAETMTEAKLLASDGIDLIQGYAFGFPSVERVWLPKDHEHRKIIIPDGLPIQSISDATRL